LDVNKQMGRQVVDEITAAGGRAHAFSVDITDLAQVRAAIADFDPVAGLVNCAGWDRMARFVDTDPTLWRKIVDINLFGTLNMLYAVLPGMVTRKFGRIVNIASDAGRVGSFSELSTRVQGRHHRAW
jgi:2-hydroxycyclohexanecarboxyl-CoA dehydrogenase